MTFVKFLLCFILLPSLATASGVDQDTPVQEDQGKQDQEKKESAYQPNGAPLQLPFEKSLGNEDLPEFKVIDAFQIKLGESGFAAGIPSDTSMAILVNPFTIRKRRPLP